MTRRPFSVRRLLVGVIFLTLFCWALSAATVVVIGRQTHLEKADAVVVLGAAQYDGRPSPVLKSRLDHAIDVWKDGYAPLLVLTGGSGKGDTTTEAEVGRKYAISQGVPSSAIVVEKAGRTTSESLRAVSRILEARELQSTILVSDAFHMFRLRVLAHKFGIEAITSPAPASPITANPSQGWRYVLSESFKAPLAFFLERS